MMLGAIAPVDVFAGCGEIHAHYRPAHGFAEWWVVLVPGCPPYFDMVTP